MNTKKVLTIAGVGGAITTILAILGFRREANKTDENECENYDLLPAEDEEETNDVNDKEDDLED